MTAWGDAERADALEYASPAAVRSLFAYQYPGGGVDFRGCSTPPPGTPATCSVRVGEDLLQLTAVQFPSGWAVTAATMET